MVAKALVISSWKQSQGGGASQDVLQAWLITFSPESLLFIFIDFIDWFNLFF